MVDRAPELSLAPNRTLVRVAAAALAAIPLAFGSLRALQTGKDFRYLITAIASLATATIITRLVATRDREAVRPLWRSMIALIGATIVAAGVAYGLGARSGPAIWFVALGFSVCMTASTALGQFARS
jgi:hypothetical protein